MTGLKQYLLSITAAALLLSLVMALLPKGRQRRVASFVGSLLLILTVIAPTIRLDPAQLAESLSRLRMEAETMRTGIEIGNREIVAGIIKEQCEAYILDKAASRGVSLLVEIRLSEEGSYPYPTGVTLRGHVLERDREALSVMIEEELGIPKDSQEWSTR